MLFEGILTTDLNGIRIKVLFHFSGFILAYENNFYICDLYFVDFGELLGFIKIYYYVIEAVAVTVTIHIGINLAFVRRTTKTISHSAHLDITYP